MFSDFGEVGDLLLDQRRPHEPRQMALDGYPVLGELERHRLGEAGEAVLGRTRRRT